MDSNLVQTILGTAANAASGGILGLVGSIGTGIVSIFQAKNQYKHDEAMAALELQRIAAASDAQSKLSAEQLKLTQEQGANASFEASQVAAGSLASNVPSWIAGILSLWRPTLTAGLTIFVAEIYPGCAPDMRDFIIRATVTAWTAAIMWWFGSRQMLQFVPSKPSANSIPSNPPAS